MADFTNYKSNPSEYLLELIEEGRYTYEQLATALLSCSSTDHLRDMMHANEIWPNRCGCGEDIADDESKCDDCKQADEVQEFIDEQDEDEIDIAALEADIENNNFDIVLQYDQVEKLYGKVNLIQASLENGLHSQARELCSEYDTDYREQLIERLDANDSVETYELLELPSWSLSTIVNGDDSGIDNSEVKMINRFMADYEGYTFSQLDSEAESYFSHNPEFGLACNVCDYVAIKLKS